MEIAKKIPWEEKSFEEACKELNISNFREVKKEKKEPQILTKEIDKKTDEHYINNCDENYEDILSQNIELGQKIDELKSKVKELEQYRNKYNKTYDDWLKELEIANKATQKLKIANDKLDNMIEVPKQWDVLQNQYETKIKELEREAKELKKSLNDKPGFFNSGATALRNKTLEDENRLLKEKLSKIGRPALNNNDVKLLINMKKMGFSHSKIARELGICKTTVAKYATKYANKIN